MLLLANFTVFESIYKKEEVLELRAQFGEFMMGLKESGKLAAGWGKCDGRGAYFLLNLDKSEELLNFLTPLILDHATVEVHPVTEFENLGAFFQKFAK